MPAVKQADGQLAIHDCAKTLRRRIDMKLKGKAAIVTGGARGLGKEYALRLCAEGARVVVADILEAAPVMEEIKRRGGEALALHTDVSDEQSANEMARKTVEAFGSIDILVNNASVFADIPRIAFFDVPVQDWDKIMAVNVKGTFLCSKAVYPQMKKQQKGKIINISSGTCFTGVPFFIHYVTSKGGIIAFSRALAREVGNDGICVNTIAPGFTISEPVQKNPRYSEEARKIAASGRCFKRDERPEDLLGTLVFLASDDSDFITGQTIVVDGGLALN
jgi:NAD(P)-dependent dehydrogenase (short-subunit alcohol dehydrogenase family)